MSDAKEGIVPYPPAEAWASVITGSLSLLTDATLPESTARTWRLRAGGIVVEWEQWKAKEHGMPLPEPGTQPGLQGLKALEDNGILLYRAWFDGLYK
jgi:hypothetical protein